MSEWMPTRSASRTARPVDVFATGEVVQGGGAAEEPVDDVVGVAHHRGPGAARERAVDVAADQGPPDRGGDEPVGAADVEV
jgi:hypothetical protein